MCACVCVCGGGTTLKVLVGDPVYALRGRREEVRVMLNLRQLSKGPVAQLLREGVVVGVLLAVIPGCCASPAVRKHFW